MFKDARLRMELQRQQFNVVSSPLPPEHWVTAPEFHYGLPFGWFEPTPTDRDSLAALNGGFVISAFAANFVTDRLRTCQVVVHRIPDASATFESVYGGLRELIANIENQQRATHEQGPFYIWLGGERAAVWEMRHLAPRQPLDGVEGSVTFQSATVITAHRGAVYRLMFNGAENDFRLWKPGFLTAIATWTWTR